MQYKETLTQIKKLEEKYKKLNKKILSSNILNSKKNSYLSEDKKEFLILWKKYIVFFKELRKLIRKNKFRKFFFYLDYNKLLIKRYLLIFYYNCLVDLVNHFWKHEVFIRIFLKENFKYDFGKIAKFIYIPSYINLLNTPLIFLSFIRKKINKDLIFMFSKEKNLIWKNKRVLTDYKNFYFNFKNRWYIILFYLSEKVGRVVAKTKFSTRKKGLISDKNIKKYLKISKPWDIFLTRGNWNATNMTIPGFWKHMSMYLWTWEYLKNIFLQKFNKKSEKKIIKFIENLENNKHYIIEATWDWVKIKTIEDFIFNNDYLWVSRTIFSKQKITKVLEKAISYFWIPYDYAFNFYSNTNVVCSELILKSYAKENKEDEWLKLKLKKGRLILTYPPNNLVEEIFKKKSDLKFIFFIDSIDKTWENFISIKQDFRESWKRSRFSFLLK